LYQDKKEDQWTFYISLKRQMIKKQNAMQSKINKLLNKDTTNAQELKLIEKQDKLAKKRKVQAKKIAKLLGQRKVANIHLDKYTSELKELIAKLHEDNLFAFQKQGNLSDQKPLP
jgi:hypothetical protein